MKITRAARFRDNSQSNLCGNQQELVYRKPLAGEVVRSNDLRW